MARQARTAATPAEARKRGPRPGLSREAIAGAGLELVDEEGLEALTMQRLAEHLGVGTMTLYGYFRSKSELLDAITDAAVGDRRPAAHTGGWREQLRALVMAAHENLVRHPALVALRLRGPVLRPEALRFGEAILGILHDAGFEPPDAARSFRLVFTYVLGYAALSPAGTSEEQRREAAAAIALLPADEYPNFKRAGDEASRAMAGAEAFEFGLDRLLDGLESYLASGETSR